MRCPPESKAPLEADVLALMREVWRRHCRNPGFASRHADLCARAMVAELDACGTAVRDNFWVLVRPRPPVAVIKAAARFARRLTKDGYIPVRLLIRAAAREFVKILQVK